MPRTGRKTLRPLRQEPRQERSVSMIGGPVTILGRGLVIDVSHLPPGDYWLDVGVGMHGVQPLRGRRGITIR